MLRFFRKFLWAIMIAYMLGFHNVYFQKDDMANNMELHDYFGQAKEDSNFDNY